MHSPFSSHFGLPPVPVSGWDNLKSSEEQRKCSSCTEVRDFISIPLFHKTKEAGDASSVFILNTLLLQIPLDTFASVILLLDPVGRF